MTEPAGPGRIAVVWSPEGRADLRAIDRETAGFRLRCGDYRVFFDLKDENTIAITAVRNRREAYR